MFAIFFFYSMTNDKFDDDLTSQYGTGFFGHRQLIFNQYSRLISTPLALGSQRIDGPVNHFLYHRCISHVLLRAWRRVIQI
jgi:hypothetical protein